MLDRKNTVKVTSLVDAPIPMNIQCGDFPAVLTDTAKYYPIIFP